MPRILVASSNSGKIAEFRLALDLRLRDDTLNKWSAAAIPNFRELSPCIEDGESFTENARKKALYYSGFTPELVLADDSGLQVDALGGAPGIYSRRFAGEHATDLENNAKLLDAMINVPMERRGAQFVCVLAIAQNQKIIAEFRGVARGVILRFPRGTNGFGYDPLFLDPILQKTFAELTSEEKLERSHRGQAMRQLVGWLRSHCSP